MLSKKYMLLYFVIFFSTLVVFRFNGFSFFVWSQLLFCVYMLIKTQKIFIIPYKMVNIVFMFSAISAISALTTNMPTSYKNAACFSVLLTGLLYFTVSYTYGMIKMNRNTIEVIKKAFKKMCLIQLYYIPFQYVIYHVFNIDINKIIFTDLLGLLDKASFYRDWLYYPSGFTWHSAILAPMFIFAFFMFDNLFIRILIVFDAIICGNSTSLIGLVVCIFLFFILNKSKKIKNVKKMTIVIFIFSIIIILIAIYKSNILSVVYDRLFYIYARLFLQSFSDSSTNVHIRYFFDAYEIMKNSDILQLLFGYGDGCSGYWMSNLYGMYTSLGNWAVECDIVNILINRGILGFLFYYTFIFYIIITGFKTDKKYFIIMTSIFVQGFGYNVQWDYVLFMECILFFSLKLNINFFEKTDNNLKLNY